MHTVKNLKAKEITVTLAAIARYMEVIDPLQKNVRKVESYNRPEQVDSIREYGLLEPIWVVAADKGAVDNGERKYIPLKGFTRRESLESLVKTYPDGYKSEDGTTRKFDHVVVRVVDTTDPVTRLLLKLDHGDHRGLSRLELFNAFEQMYLLQSTEKDMVTKLRGSIEVNYPPDKKLPDVPNPLKADGTAKLSTEFLKEVNAYETALLKHYKGVIQQYKLIAQAPNILREVCLQKLEGTKKWPTNEELRDGMKIFEDESTKDGMVSKDNPGPLFKKWFDDTAAVKAAGEADGTLRGKTTAMMNAQQVRDLLKQITDPRLRRMIQVILRQVPVTNAPMIDKIAAAAPLTDEQKSILSGMQESATASEPTPSEEPAKTEEELPV